MIFGWFICFYIYLLLFSLHRPFESFKKFVDGFDLASMKHEQHSHVPYVVLLYKALEAWREQIGDPNALPQNYQQRKDFTGILMNMQILNEHGIYNEDNFAEAKQQIIKSFSGAKVGFIFVIYIPSLVGRKCSASFCRYAFRWKFVDYWRSLGLLDSCLCH
jgi:hypothetical protein